MMKKIFLLLTIVLFSSANAAESISNYLKLRIPQGQWEGRDLDSKCSVFVRHDQQVTDDSIGSTFEVSIYSIDRQIKTSYKLNDSTTIGGRGDCPQLLNDSMNEIFVHNRADSAPCFSSYRHTNHGGLQIFFEGKMRNYRIFNEKGELIRECKISLK